MTDLEHTFREAFRAAEKSRSDAGMRARAMKTRKRRDGSSTLDVPHSYKVTLWLPAWYYADVMAAKARDRHQGSLTKYIHAMIEAQVPPVSARPKPKGARAGRVKARAAAKNGRHLRVAA